MTVDTARPESLQPVLGLPDPGERVPRLAWPSVGLYVVALLLFGGQVVGIVGGWSPWLTVPTGAAVTFLMFTVLHEAIHHAVSTSTKANNLFGHLSIPFVAPYATFPMIKFIHIEHHRNTNEAKLVDPDHWTTEGPWWQLPIRWVTLDVWYVVFYLKNIARRPRREAVTTMAVFFGVVVGLALLSRAGNGAVVVIWLAGQRIGVLILAWWFDYLPHHGLTRTQRQDKYQATRIRVGGEWWLTPLFVYQNYHLVHHLHPSVPFYRYITAWRRNEQAYLDRNAAISTWFGRTLSPEEYRTWRRITNDYAMTPDRASGRRPVFHPLRVESVEPLTGDSVIVGFEVPADLAEDYRYAQGQHITLRAVIDGRDVRRSYSIIESVAANRLRIAVKQLPGGVFSTYVNQDLRLGDVLDVMSPTGRFRTALEPTRPRHYVAVAAGSGITPLMSIIATTLETEGESTFTLVLGNRTAESTMFRDRLVQMQASVDGRLTVHHVLSRSPGAELSGRITATLVRDLVPGRVDAWFLCGPQGLVDSVGADLGTTERVLTEVFHTEPGAPTGAGVDVESRVTVALDGIETTFHLRSTGETILDAALQAGVEPPYSCAGGACGTCRAKVVLGKAVMDQNHVLDDAEIAAGYVLTCQSHPVTGEVGIDFDA